MNRMRQYRPRWSWSLRLPGHLFRVAFPLWVVIPLLAACHLFVDDDEEPCVETHDRGCLSEPEFQALVDEIAAGYAEPSAFRNQWGLKAINADVAYANLELQLGPGVAPGEGVTVGVLDTGIDTAFPQFENKAVVERFLPDASDEDGSEVSHGTAVAGILAGEDIPGFPHDAHGVAWGADLVVFAIPLGEAPELYDPIRIDELAETAEYFAETFDEILAWRSGSASFEFLNLSLGVSGLIENYGEEAVREPFAPMVASMVQEGAEDKVVFVWSAGNDHGTACDLPIPQCVDGAVVASSADILSALAVHFPALRENTVTVVAIRPDGGIADFSNRCGIAAEYCLAAPGDEVLFPYFGPHEGEIGVRAVAAAGGTSFAAPMVTGGLAVMKQYFRGQLSNTDLLARLLETADRSGIYAEAAIYGRGLMDLGAATSPVGAQVVAMGDRVESAGAALQDTGLQLGQAFGDALAPALAGQQIAAFDTLGAPFWYDVGAYVSVAARPSLHDRFRDFRQLSLSPSDGLPSTTVRLPILEARGEPHGAFPGLYLAHSGASPAGSAGHFGLARHSVVASLPVHAGLSATLLTTEGLARQEPATGAALTWRAPEAPLGLRAGWMGERQTLLGSEAEGAFGELVAHAAFAGLEADTALGRWRLGGTAEIGTVNARAKGGVIQGFSPLATSAFALHATRRHEDGSALRVSLSQPLRVESGRAVLALPAGRTTAGAVIRSTLASDVEPGGRQVDLGLHWQKPLALGELRLGATLSHDPGHRGNADAELVLLSGWQHRF